MFWRATAIAAAFLSLSGCGVIYTAPDVHGGASFAGAYGTDYDVEVVPLTHQSAAAANLEPYVPARLPAAFSPDVVEAALADSVALPNLAPLPPPTARRVTRPDAIADEFPPPAGPVPYRIGTGDVLLLAVEGITTLEGLPALLSAQAKREGYVVQDDGAISIPDAGRVRVAGLTLKETEAEISEALLAANIDPSFSLEIAEFNSKRVAVGGLVGGPTLVPIALQPLRLFEAIEGVGGITANDPRVSYIQLFRDGQIYRFSVERYLNDPAVGQILLRDGDSIYVGDAYREAEAQRFFQEQLSLRGAQMQATQFQLQLEDIRTRREENARQKLIAKQELFEKRLALGAVKRHYAFITGEVRSPGEVVLPFEQPIYLSNVLFGQGTGGINIQTGDYGEIYVLRSESDPRKAGGLTAYHLDAENAANLAAATRLEMRPNDVVFVAEQPVTSWNRVISQILPQLLLSLPRQITGAANL